LDKYERAKMAGAISVLVDIEQDPIRRTQLINIISSLQSNSRLNREEMALIEDIDIFSTPFI